MISREEANDILYNFHVIDYYETIYTVQITKELLVIIDINDLKDVNIYFKYKKYIITENLVNNIREITKLDLHYD